MEYSTSRYRLGDLCEFYRGASVPRTRMHDSGDCLYIHYGDLYKGFSYCIDVERQQKPIPYILSSEKIKDELRLLDQDIVYVLTSETVGDLGHSFLFKENNCFIFPFSFQEFIYCIFNNLSITVII